MCSECPTALAGDLMGAFPTLVAHHQDLVYGVARRNSRSADEAEDLAQDAFVRAYRALVTYDAERIRSLHLRGWLARITINLARNRARDREPESADLEAVPDRGDDRAPSPERLAERRESAVMWRRLLSGLPSRYRAAVELRHVEGLSYPELAEALGKPLGTVKSDVHRGIGLLRSAYLASESTRSWMTGSEDGNRVGSVRVAARTTPEVMIR